LICSRRAGGMLSAGAAMQLASRALVGRRCSLRYLSRRPPPLRIPAIAFRAASLILRFFLTGGAAGAAPPPEMVAGGVRRHRGVALIAPIRRYCGPGRRATFPIAFRAAALIRRFVLTGAAAGATPSLERVAGGDRGTAGGRGIDRAEQAMAMLRLRPFLAAALRAAALTRRFFLNGAPAGAVAVPMDAGVSFGSNVGTGHRHRFLAPAALARRFFLAGAAADRRRRRRWSLVAAAVPPGRCSALIAPDQVIMMLRLPSPFAPPRFHLIRRFVLTGALAWGYIWARSARRNTSQTQATTPFPNGKGYAGGNRE